MMKTSPRCFLWCALFGALAVWQAAPRPAAAQGGIKIEKPTPTPRPKVMPRPVPPATPKPEPKTSKPSKPRVPISTPAPPRRSALEIELVLVNGGTFLMGSPDGQGNSDEHPQHRVTVPSFYMGKYEITQAQWQAVMGTNPSYFKGADLPVELVSWKDAQEFCRRLSQLTGKQYRLPTEAEWEYACRAGATGLYAGKLESLAWHGNNSGRKTHPVGKKRPNAFGLYDMHGNVSEWCEDIYQKRYEGAPTDGSAWLSGGDSSNRVYRGGSWDYVSGYCRSALRSYEPPGLRLVNLGFRVVLSSRTP